MSQLCFYQDLSFGSYHVGEEHQQHQEAWVHCFYFVWQTAPVLFSFCYVFVLERLINCTPNTVVPQKTAFSFEVICPAHHLEETGVDLLVEL